MLYNIVHVCCQCKSKLKDFVCFAKMWLEGENKNKTFSLDMD